MVVPRVGVCSACGSRTTLDDPVNQPDDGSYLVHRCENINCERYMEQQFGSVDQVEDYDDDY